LDVKPMAWELMTILKENNFLVRNFIELRRKVFGSDL
jgi:hypothetical protein